MSLATWGAFKELKSYIKRKCLAISVCFFRSRGWINPLNSLNQLPYVSCFQTMEQRDKKAIDYKSFICAINFYVCVSRINCPFKCKFQRSTYAPRFVKQNQKFTLESCQIMNCPNQEVIIIKDKDKNQKKKIKKKK